MATHIEYRIQTYDFLICILIVHFHSALATVELNSQANTYSASSNDCPPGYYGAGCVSKCPVLCDVTCTDEGHCTSCETPGVKLPGCQEICSHGTFGLNCQYNCSERCNNSECDSSVGHCRQCTDPGVKLPYCNITCVNGSYGLNCDNRCPLPCKESCDPVNGTCTVCSFGKGPQCMVNCAINSDLEACKLYCPSKCLTLCNTTDGRCSFCVPGYEAPFCNTSCRPGTYGSNCKETCSNRCKDRLCDPFTGACYNCNDGYVGRKCNGQCIPGYYGQECDLVCPETCLGGLCDFVNGSCHACQNGYKGHQCDELCSDGRHGENCTMECPETCFKACDPVTGQCWRCAPGYEGTFCNNTCPNGTYGESCIKMCHTGCQKFICDHVNGDCLTCKPGFQGLKCDVIHLVGEGSKLHLGLYVTFGLLTVILLFGTSMCCYKHMVNKFEAKAKRRSQNILEKKNADRDLSTEGESGLLHDKKVIRSRNDFNLLNAEADNPVNQEERERNRKLVKYILNHGKTYTPQGCGSAMKKLEQLNSDSSHKATALSTLRAEQADPQRKQSPVLPDRSEVSLTISTTTDDNQVMEINASTESRKVHQVIGGVNQISETTTRFNATYRMGDKSALGNKTGHVEVSSVANYNKRRQQTLEECFRARNTEHMSQMAVAGSDNVLQDPAFFLPNQTAEIKEMKITSTTVSVVAHQTENINKVADSMTMIMTQSVKNERCKDAASADSLYGVTSQDFSSSKKIDNPTETSGVTFSGSVQLRQQKSVMMVTQVASAHRVNNIETATSANRMLGSGHLNRVISEHAVFQSFPSDHPSSKPDFVFIKEATPGGKNKQSISNSDSAAGICTDRLKEMSIERVNTPSTQIKSLVLTGEDVSKNETASHQVRSDLVKDEPKSTCSYTSRRGNSGSSSHVSASSNIQNHQSEKMKSENTEERVEKKVHKNPSESTGMKASGLRAMKSTDKLAHRKRYAMNSSSSSESTSSTRPKPDAFDEMIFNSNFTPAANNFSTDKVYQSHKARASTKALTSAGSRSSFQTHKPKQYRKLSPPKVTNHASRKSSADQSDFSESSEKEKVEVNCLARRSDVNAHFLREEQKRESACPITQFSYVRASSSAMIKGELLSPRLVRCSTTRQLSPLYGLKPSTPIVSRLQPLPTPPPEGRMKLKPVSKNSSISQNSGGSNHGTETSDGP